MPGACRRARSGWTSTTCRFAYPSADKVSLASLEEVSTLDTRGGVEVIHDVTFRAEPGQVVALVGSSGAGKSTIAQLVARLYDADEGVVRIGGVDVRDLSFASLRQTLGMVTQDGHLFHSSVRENLLLAKESATEDELWAGPRAGPGWTSWCASLPDGLDTVVGERGYRLSGGERQRLTIARLLLAHPRVVILDEATAHLDSTSEMAVQAALAEALAGRTAIVIAHRLSTVVAADLILVVEAGRIVERGRHEELLAAGGRYAELYRTQFAAVRDCRSLPTDGRSDRPSSCRQLGRGAAAARGRVTANRVRPGWLSTSTRPWWASTTAATMARPRPVLPPVAAPGVRTRLTSARVNRSKTRSAISGGMPGPLSVTVIIAASPVDTDPGLDQGARRGVGTRVGQQVGDHLVQPVPVGQGDDRLVRARPAARCAPGPATRASLTALITTSVRSVGWMSRSGPESSRASSSRSSTRWDIRSASDSTRDIAYAASVGSSSPPRRVSSA